MALSYAGNGTITGLSVGGLPDGTVDADTLASGVGGKVLNVVQTVKTDVYTTNSSSWIKVGTGGTELAVSITPSATSSKILVLYSMPVSSQTVSCSQHFALYRDSTHIFKGDSSSSRAVVTIDTDSYGAGDKATRLVAGQFLDSPSSTSALSYAMYVRRSTGSTYTINVNRCSQDYDNDDSGRQASSITVMEISS